MEETAEKTAEKTFTWLALRNPSSAKRKCRRIRNTLILGLVYPSKDYSLGRGPRVLMSMVSAIAW
jgi:hypothetical protein